MRINNVKHLAPSKKYGISQEVAFEIASKIRLWHFHYRINDQLNAMERDRIEYERKRRNEKVV